MKFQFINKGEPITGETLNKAIVFDQLNEVDRILDSAEGPIIIELPDKIGNLPLMIAVMKNNLEFSV